MSERLTIETDDILVEVLPSLGGSLAAFDLSRGNERLPVFRRWSGESENPRTFASIPMVPWFARISGGGITWDSRFYPIARNDQKTPTRSTATAGARPGRWSSIPPSASPCG